MKNLIIALLISLNINVLYAAEYITLDSLRLTKNFTIKDKAILHNVIASNTINDTTAVIEFVHQGTLYILSSVFHQDYNEYMRDFPDVPSLVQKIMSICVTECRTGDCGYRFTYDSGLPSVLTVYTYPNMDTLQYVTTNFPQLFVASIRDTIFGSTNIYCGNSLKDLYHELSIEPLYYHDFAYHKTIVLIAAEFDSLIYDKEGYIGLPCSCFVIESNDGIITKIEVRQTDYFSKDRIIMDFELY